MAFAMGLLSFLSFGLLFVAVSRLADPVVMERAGLGGQSDMGSSAGTGTARGPLPRRLVALAGEGLPERLARSGWRVDLDDLVRVKFSVAAAGVVCVVLVASGAMILLAPVVGLAGWRVPDIALARAVRRRSRALDARIPSLMDLLATASSAGLSAPLALRRSAQAVSGPLAEELSRVLEGIDLGRPWRDELDDLVRRNPSPDLRRAMSALTRSGALGSSLADQTAVIAGEIREARRAAVTDRARKAPVKMLFPLVFMVLPAFLLLTIVPVLVSTLKSIG
jgi:tight adherence protein C